MVQIMRFPRGNISQTVQIRNISDLKDVDREVRIDRLSDVYNFLGAVAYSALYISIVRSNRFFPGGMILSVFFLLLACSGRI